MIRANTRRVLQLPQTLPDKPAGDTTLAEAPAAAAQLNVSRTPLADANHARNFRVPRRNSRPPSAIKASPASRTPRFRRAPTTTIRTFGNKPTLVDRPRALDFNSRRPHFIANVDRRASCVCNRRHKIAYFRRRRRRRVVRRRRQTRRARCARVVRFYRRSTAGVA